MRFKANILATTAAAIAFYYSSSLLSSARSFAAIPKDESVAAAIKKGSAMGAMGEVCVDGRLSNSPKVEENKRYWASYCAALNLAFYQATGEESSWTNARRYLGDRTSYGGALDFTKDLIDPLNYDPTKPIGKAFDEFWLKVDNDLAASYARDIPKLKATPQGAGKSDEEIIGDIMKFRLTVLNDQIIKLQKSAGTSFQPFMILEIVRELVRPDVNFDLSKMNTGRVEDSIQSKLRKLKDIRGDITPAEPANTNYGSAAPLLANTAG